MLKEREEPAKIAYCGGKTNRCPGENHLPLAREQSLLYRKGWEALTNKRREIETRLTKDRGKDDIAFECTAVNLATLTRFKTG